MKTRFLFGAIAALCLSATSANALSIIGTGADGTTSSQVQLWAYNTNISDYDVIGYMQGGSVPVFNLNTANFRLDGTPFSTVMDSKQDASSAFDGVYSHLTSKPTLFSGAYADLTGKPSIPTIPSNISSFTNDSGYLTSSSLSSYLTSSTAASTYVPKTLTVNGHALSANITVTASDVGAAASSTVIGTGATLGTAATDANTAQVTNYNLVSGVLGLANGLNDANTAQNDLATKYNDLATKYNTLLAMLKARNVPSN